jgi:hypothetical protein
MSDIETIAVDDPSTRRRLLRIGLLAIVASLIAAIALFATIAKPTSLGAAKASVREGMEEARQLWLGVTFWPNAPYPDSEVIEGFELDWSTHQRGAEGSGDWGITWADNDHQYTAWGNGGGFGEPGADDRVFLGFARIEGDADNYRAVNVWGGADAENPAEFGGKAYSLLSVEGTLYTWRCGDTDGATSLDFQELYRSTDYSATWRSTGVKFTQSSFADGDPGFYCPTFLQFGKDYGGARDDYVYMYAPNIQQTASLYPQVPGEVILIRAPKTRVNVRSAYEFYAGVGTDGEPVWTFDANDRLPVFEDAENGITQHIATVYNPGLDRYILATEHSAHAEGNIGIYDAPTPWGPWTTVHFSDSFGRFETLDNGFMWVFPSKWLSENGEDFVMIYTGKGRNDSWNTLKGRFLLADGGD